MSIKQYTAKPSVLSSWIHQIQLSFGAKFTPFSPLRKWLDSIEVKDRDFAHKLCLNIPTQCPFERKITFFGHTVLTIPPLCKLNPFYNEIVALRFRAICYLADECGEDVSAYC